MIGTLKFVLFLFLLFLAAVQSNLLNANDAQTCMDLCASCDGIATFENEICKCAIPEDDAKGLECVRQLKQEDKVLDLDSAKDNSETAERSARCDRVGSRNRLRPVDADRIVSYFIKGGPVVGTPLLDSTISACGTSSSDPMIGAINPSNAIPLPAESNDGKQNVFPVTNRPIIVAPSHTYSSSQNVPTVSSSWVPSHDVGFSPMIGNSQPYQTAFYPQMVGAIPQLIMAIPNQIMRAISPSRPSGTVVSSNRSPVLASLAQSTRNALQRMDKMVAPYASQNYHNNIVGASQHHTSNCALSSKPSYSVSSMESAPVPSTQPTWMSDSLLQQAFAQQNSMLQALSNKLESLDPQVGAPRIQYTSATPVHYRFAAPQPMSQYAMGPMVQYAPQPMVQYAPTPMVQYAPQPMGQYCQDRSTIFGSPKAAESSSMLSAAPPMENELVAASNPSSSSKVDMHKDSIDSKIENDASERKADIDKTVEKAKRPEEEERQKFKRESRTRSSNRKKRGDVNHKSHD